MKAWDGDMKTLAVTLQRLDQKQPLDRPGRNGFLFDVISQFIQRRKELGLSQEDVDDRMGTAERLCSKWECGQRIPTSFNFYCWAQALDAFLVLFPRTERGMDARGR